MKFIRFFDVFIFVITIFFLDITTTAVIFFPYKMKFFCQAFFTNVIISICAVLELVQCPIQKRFDTIYVQHLFRIIASSHQKSVTTKHTSLPKYFWISKKKIVHFWMCHHKNNSKIVFDVLSSKRFFANVLTKKSIIIFGQIISQNNIFLKIILNFLPHETMISETGANNDFNKEESRYKMWNNI
ncbi:hypothetical protein RFI_12648 [Reticulomyxa filosa]|uniref:Uncharacterized protein n=1 Tax=Reticulomyxa filosa TaxID=46433 RepID=X6NDW1_RETFI|nr:hypothetical protein RFI_12648 [Reticulomyxa filosa]|eukprot:ETO24510.1 hypothetical protein RFI_12648 [Reticulomyxa filosa]